MMKLLFLLSFIATIIAADDTYFIEIDLNGEKAVYKSNVNVIHYERGMNLQFDCGKSPGLGGDIYPPLITIYRTFDKTKKLIISKQAFQVLGRDSPMIFLDTAYDGNELECVFEENGAKTSKKIKFIMNGKLEENGIFSYILIGLGVTMSGAILIFIIICLFGRKKKTNRHSLIDDGYAEPVVMGIVNSSAHKMDNKTSYLNMTGA